MRSALLELTVEEATETSTEASDVAASDVRNAADLISCIFRVQKLSRSATGAGGMLICFCSQILV